LATSVRFAWTLNIGLGLGLVGGCASMEDTPDPVPLTPNDAGLVLDAALAMDSGAPAGRAADASQAVGPVPGSAPDAGITATRDAASDAASNAAGDAGAAAMTGADAAAGPDAPAGGALQSVCAGGKAGTDSTKQSAASEYGAVKFQLAISNQILRLQTTLRVPEKPKARSTLFIWPGLQWLRGKDPARLGNGILQPVLTWGPSCAPGTRTGYDSWWVSGMYVNVSTAAAGPTGCAGGEIMDVGVGDALRMDMNLAGTTWTQTITDDKTGKSVDYGIDLKGQFQDWATWAIELKGGGAVPPEDVIFTDSVLTFADKVSSCQMSQRGPNDYYSAPVLAPDGLHCCYSKIILRTRNVAATSPNEP
jgi:hypothetical protein